MKRHSFDHVWCGVGLLVTGAALADCSSGTADSPTTSESGGVSAALSFPGGDAISTVNWVITGPNGAATIVEQGTADLQDASTLTIVVGGLPPAATYVIAVSGTSDGGSTCVGTIQFSVAARTTTSLSVPLSCGAATADSGVVAITGKAFACASVTGLWAMPSEVIVGHALTLTASASAPDPSSILYTWSAPSGSFLNANGATTNFTCMTAGSVPITVTVSDGDGGTCNPALSSSTVLVTCSP
jgi:hypothetical protein